MPARLHPKDWSKLKNSSMCQRLGYSPVRASTGSRSVVERNERNSPLLGPLSLALDQFVIRAVAAVMGHERKDRRGISGPVTREVLRRNLPPAALIALAVG